MIDKAEYENNTVTIKHISDFDPEAILFCGQAFRWAREKNLFRGVAFKRVVCIEMREGTLRIFPASKKDFEEIWEDYFDLKRDYKAVKDGFSKDIILQKGMEYAPGMRVLNQEPFETMISFILSSNNNIKRISGIIEKLCMRYGEKIDFAQETYFAFPDAASLADAEMKDLMECGTGYRARYVKAAAQAVYQGFNLQALKKMPYAEAKKELTGIPGVGEKVADCILLYSLGFVQAFPLDVWVRRTIFNLYGCSARNDKELNNYICSRFGEYAGLAQQYLFHYVRKNRLGLRKEEYNEKWL